MASDIILYESDDVQRPDKFNIHGPPELSAALLETATARYKEKPIGIYPKKRIALTKLKNVRVSGFEPVITPETAQPNIESAAILVQKWGYGFYHFVNEMLPKILRANEYNPKIPIITFYNDTFIKDILKFAGITNPIIPYDGQSPYIIKDAIHITETASGNPTPSDIAIIRRHLRITPAENRDVNILIYRKESKRSISNFVELRDTLKRHFPDKKWFVFDSLPFDAAVKLFARANLIVAAHGAGLSNMIFAPKGTPIIEISPADSFNACFWHLSWILSNPHHFLAAKSSGAPFHNMEVDVKTAVALIETLSSQ